jgi:purine nucleosidase
MVGHLIIMGGTVTGPGNVTPAAEFNIYCNPEAARTVFRSPVTKTLVPLDVTSRVVLTYDLLRQLPGERSKTGTFLGRILPSAFRSYRRHLGLEGIPVHDAVAMVAAIRPELFQTEEMVGDVETAGNVTLGATVFDRRRVRSGQPNMEVVVDMDRDAVVDYIIRGLQSAT